MGIQVESIEVSTSNSRREISRGSENLQETKMAGCVDSFGKYLILMTNLVFLLASLGVIGFGTYMEVQMGNYLEFASMAPMKTSYCLIVLGAVMFIVSFFGCCGAYKENKCMIFTHATFMTLITVVLVGLAAALAIGITDENLKPKIETKMRELLQNYGKPEHAGVTETWDFIQENLECSGVSSYKDWKTTAFGGEGAVPDSCCKEVKENCGVGIGLVVFLLLAVVVSCCHGRRLGHQSYDSVEQ